MIYENYEPKTVYKVAFSTYLRLGGEGYEMLKNNIKNVQIGDVDVDVYKTYIKKMSPITQETDERITILNKLSTE